MTTALALSACGGDSAEEGPADVVKQFISALAVGDAEAACSYASAEALAALENQGDGTCEEAVTALAGDLPEDAVQNAEEATYEVTEETEDSATVEATDPDGGVETFDLVKDGDVWKISS